LVILEPTVWQHSTVVIRKKTGSPKRKEHMQKRNDACLRQTHSFVSPYHKAMLVPRNTYKMVKMPGRDITWVPWPWNV
jgi:hypothetical protein